MRIEFQCTEEDYLNNNKFFYKQAFNDKIASAILIPLACGYFFAGDPFNNTQFVLVTIASAIIYILSLYILPYFITNRKIRNLNPQSAYTKKIMSITDEGLYVESETSNNTLKWESIISVDSNEEYIILAFVDKKITLIPRTTFSNNVDQLNFIGTVQTKILKHRPYKKEKEPYSLGFLCFIPLIDALIGLIFIIYGITKKDKWFVLIGIGGVLFTILIYYYIYLESTNLH